MQNKKIRNIVKVLIVLTMGFIFYNSFLPADDSLEMSGGFYAFIKPLLNIILPDKLNNEGFVRKMAHFSEFGLLSFEFSYFMMIEKKKENIPVTLLICLLTALTDETIQLVSSRGSMVLDVWIDFSGAVTFLIIYILLNKLFSKFITKTSK